MGRILAAGAIKSSNYFFGGYVHQVIEEPSAWMLRLRVRHLEVFRMLVETGSQSETATRMHITQPALSKWLRELESHAGCSLFDRGRQLKLTACGELLLRYAERVLGDSVRTARELEALLAGSSGLLRVGVLRAVAPLLVPRAIVRCRGEAPRLQIRIHEDSQDVLLPALRRHELDCVIGRLQGEALAGAFFSEALYAEPVLAIVRPAHPLLRLRRVTLAQAAAYPWIVALPGTPMRIRLEAEFAAAGTAMPQEVVESVSLLLNAKLLQSTDMVSVVSQQLAQHYEETGALKRLPLVMKQALGPVGLIWGDSEPSNAVRRFLDAVRTEAAALRPVARVRGGRKPALQAIAGTRR
jgi:DNA-binding transcriptional LysR family regulator